MPDPLRAEELMGGLASHEELRWEYDDEADVLYIAVGAPRPAVTVDLVQGFLARYAEQSKEVVGITVVGFRSRLLEGLRKEAV